MCLINVSACFRVPCVRSLSTGLPLTYIVSKQISLVWQLLVDFVTLHVLVSLGSDYSLVNFVRTLVALSVTIHNK